MKKKLLYILGIVYSFSAIAAATNPPENTIKAALKNKLPDLVVDSILPTPIDGVYEVDSGRKVFYVNKSADYAFIGNLIDLNSKVSLTEDRTNRLNKIEWSRLPVDVAIRRVIVNKKEPTKLSKIAVFTDPDCPFCKRLETETLSKLQGVVIYYYLFPLPIHPNAAEHARKILCAENPESSLLGFMAKDAPLGKNASCKDGIKKLTQMQEIANTLVQVNATPTIILPNGRIVSGLIPADNLTNLISNNQLESTITTLSPSATTATAR